jgi:hypothetical protein
MKQWPEKITSRYSDEYRFELQKVEPTYKDKPGRAKYHVIDIKSGEVRGTPVFDSIENLEAFADDLIKPQGGTQSTNLGEDLNMLSEASKGAFDLGLGKGHHIDERMDDEDFDSLEDAIANREFGMDYDQLGDNEKEWVRDEIDNMSMNEVTSYSGFNRNPEDPDSEPFNPTGAVAEFKEDLRALFGKFKGDLKNPEFIKGVGEIMVSWKSLLRSQLDEGNDKIKDLEQLFDFHTQMDNKGQASIIKDKIEKLRKLSNSGEIDGDEFLDKFNPLQKQLKSIAEASRARVSMPRFVKDKNNPNFLNVYIDYDLGPGGSSIALGKETMTGQIRRESAAEAMRLAGDVAKDLEAEYNLEDIDIQDLENGKVRIFAVSDDFIDMDPNMLKKSKFKKHGEMSGFDMRGINEANGFKSGKDFINAKLQKYPKAIAKINQLISMVGDKFSLEMAEWIFDFFNNASYESPVNEAFEDLKRNYENYKKTGINEAKATCCHRCGRVHVKGTPCKKPYLKGKKSCAIKEVQDLQEMYRKVKETKSAPEGHYFTKSGNLVKGRMTKDAEERGARKSDPKDKMRSKIPKVTQYTEAVEEYIKSNPRMKKSKMMEAVKNILKTNK